MNTPDVARHNPSPQYLRGLIEAAGLPQVEVARRIGLSERMLRYYLADGGGHRAPYVVQYAIEGLALPAPNPRDSMLD